MNDKSLGFPLGREKKNKLSSTRMFLKRGKQKAKGKIKTTVTNSQRYLRERHRQHSQKRGARPGEGGPQ